MADSRSAMAISILCKQSFYYIICVSYNKWCVYYCVLLFVVNCWCVALICNENDGNSQCNFVKALDIVTKYLTDGLPTLENLIIDTNIMKIAQAFTKL